MSYQVAYTTHFRSADNTVVDIVIYIDDYGARPLEICLEGDEPCVIEWQETGKMDVVQSSTCTLRVSNESDRQMVQLMSHPEAMVIVSRDGKEYWRGTLDDAVYEEPYSFNKAYVTEITFSDFGILNRVPFGLTGKQSVAAIVGHCLEGACLDGVDLELLTSLLEPKTQQPITLDMLYINADRFEADGESWDEMTSRREVLEEILRPLGLRIMQKGGRIHIYDIEYLRDPDNWCWNYIVWKGTDACLKGSETFGWFEVAFEPDADETLADGEIDYDDDADVQWAELYRYFALSYNDDNQVNTGFGPHLEIGFYIQPHAHIGPEMPIDTSRNARLFRTVPVFCDNDDIGVAWRIKCLEIYHEHSYYGNVSYETRYAVLADNHTAMTLNETETVLSIVTGYIPIVPDRLEYQLRVNLDFLLSFRTNPFDSPPDEWVEQQDFYGFERIWKGMNTFAIMVPVKLELLDENGNVVYHYKNANATDVSLSGSVNACEVTPFGIGNGRWVYGAAASYGDMFLAYYKDYKSDDEDRDPLVTKGGWVTNRMALSKEMQINGTLYRVRDDGEYLPMPPEAGRLRLTVGSGVFLFHLIHHNAVTIPLLPSLYYSFSWQAYRNPKISIVKARRRDDGINTDDQYERDMIQYYADHFSETVKAGCWSKGIAPSARGLLFNADGTVWEKFIKDGSARTLQEHRLRCIEDQTFNTQPVISGTAELDPQFCAKREGSTQGIFLVTALRQDLHQDTEEVTMARIAGVGGFVYEYDWGDPICVKEEPMEYSFRWSDPICAKEPEPNDQE